MTEVDTPSAKPLASYILPRRDESIVAALPQSLAPSRPGVVSAPSRAPVHAPPLHAPSAMADDMREEDRTMVARSRFGDDTSVHDERTVIGQIPREALEFERMFAQRTQPPPAEPKGAADASPTARPPAPLPNAPPLPAFDSGSFGPPKEDSESHDDSESGNGSTSGADSENEDEESSSDAESGDSSPPDGSSSESTTVGDKPSSDSRGLVSLAEATHPSVARSVSARRLRVTLITLVVLAVLVALFVIKMPR